MPAFELGAQSAALQERRFGSNCDFIAWFPLLPGSSERGLLCVNHEFTSAGDMLPGYDAARPSAEHVAIEMAAHGMSIFELRLEAGSWSVVLDSRFNRRVTATTEMLLTGPAAGAELLRTAADPSGTRVLGMLNNCAGGKTPWGTVLTCEENVHQYFARRARVADEALRASYAKYDFRNEESLRRWELHHERFDLSRHPHEGPD